VGTTPTSTTSNPQPVSPSTSPSRSASPLGPVVAPDGDRAREPALGEQRGVAAPERARDVGREVAADDRRDVVLPEDLLVERAARHAAGGRSGPGARARQRAAGGERRATARRRRPDAAEHAAGRARARRPATSARRASGRAEHEQTDGARGDDAARPRRASRAARARRRPAAHEHHRDEVQVVPGRDHAREHQHTASRVCGAGARERRLQHVPLREEAHAAGDREAEQREHEHRHRERELAAGPRRARPAVDVLRPRVLPPTASTTGERADVASV
jgi:hypothetical protein